MVRPVHAGAQRDRRHPLGEPNGRFHAGCSWAKILPRARGEWFDIDRGALVFAAMAGQVSYVQHWRTALHAIVSAVMVVVLGLLTAAAAHAAAATATLVVTSTWQTGFIARFAITNRSAVPLTDWKLEFDLPPGEFISHSWNSNFVRSGTHYVLTPANWNRIIAPGGSATGGFRGVLSGPYSPPVNCMLNRQVLCT